MHIVDRIFDALGEATVIARETGDPVQTVHSWKAKGNIPHWRRRAVMDAARRLNKPLDADLLAHLSSSERAPRKADAEPDRAEAA